jgi:hypothetical protein
MTAYIGGTFTDLLVAMIIGDTDRAKVLGRALGTIGEMALPAVAFVSTPRVPGAASALLCPSCALREAVVSDLWEHRPVRANGVVAHVKTGHRRQDIERPVCEDCGGDIFGRER